MMKHIAFALSLLVACGKSDSSPTAQAPASPESAAPAEHAAPAAPAPGPAAPQARPTPRLPDQQAGDDGRRWGGRRGDRPNIDTDGDGKISDEERAVARKQRLDGMRTHLDANGDGKLTVDELKNAEGGGRRRMRFDDPAALDTNHDGDISADELGAAMEARREQWRQRREGGAGSGSDAAP
jgi:hypothetical protein